MTEKDKLIFTYLFDYQNLNRMTGSAKIDVFMNEVKTIIDNKEYSNINMQDSDGNTFLHLAMENDVDFELISKLIDSGADVSVKNKKGKNCFQMRRFNQSNYFTTLEKRHTLIKNLISNTINKDESFFIQFKSLHENTIKFFIKYNKNRYVGQNVQSFLYKIKQLNISDNEFNSFNIAKEFYSSNKTSQKEIAVWFKANLNNGDLRDNFFAFMNGLINERLTCPEEFFKHIGEDLILKINDEVSKEDKSKEREEHIYTVESYLNRILSLYDTEDYLKENKKSKYNLEKVVGIFLNYVINNKNSFELLDKNLNKTKSCLSLSYLNKSLEKQLKVNELSKLNNGFKI